MLLTFFDEIFNFTCFRVMPARSMMATRLAVWLFSLLALVIVGVLCAVVVLYHYLKTARMNPAETLKNE